MQYELTRAIASSLRRLCDATRCVVSGLGAAVSRTDRSGARGDAVVRLWGPGRIGYCLGAFVGAYFAVLEPPLP